MTNQSERPLTTSWTQLLLKLVDVKLRQAGIHRTHRELHANPAVGAQIEQQVLYFLSGMRLQVPSGWIEDYQALDPEYQQYLKLKARFEGSQAPVVKPTLRDLLQRYDTETFCTGCKTYYADRPCKCLGTCVEVPRRGVGKDV